VAALNDALTTAGLSSPITDPSFAATVTSGLMLT